MPSTQQEQQPSRPEWDVILSASMKNNAKEIERMITERGVSPNHCNGAGQTALHIAALWGNVEAVQVLLTYGAKVNPQNRINGATPLHSAVTSAKDQALSRRVTCVQLLLSAGADSMICDFLGRKPIDYVDRVVNDNNNNSNEDWRRLHKMLESAIPSSPIHDFISAFDLSAIHQYRFDLITVNERSTTNNGQTPIFHAATLLWNAIYDDKDNNNNNNNNNKNNNDGKVTTVTTLIDILITLIGNGANLDQPNDNTRNNITNDGDDVNAVEAIVINEWVRRFCSTTTTTTSDHSNSLVSSLLQRIILEKGWEDYNSTNTILFLLSSSCGAANEDSLVLLILQRLLLVHGNPNLPNNEGMTPLCQTLNSIVSLSNNTNSNDNQGMQQQERLFLLATILVQNGGILMACTQQPEQQQSNVLHDAARRGNIQVINFILQNNLVSSANEDINAPGRQGLTPLHFAARSGKLEVAKALLDAGADWTKLDNMGKSPLDAAVTNNKMEMMELLQTYHTARNMK